MNLQLGQTTRAQTLADAINIRLKAGELLLQAWLRQVYCKPERSPVVPARVVLVASWHPTRLAWCTQR
jgi:hypothetical protein